MSPGCRIRRILALHSQFSWPVVQSQSYTVQSPSLLWRLMMMGMKGPLSWIKRQLATPFMVEPQINHSKPRGQNNVGLIKSLRTFQPHLIKGAEPVTCKKKTLWAWHQLIRTYSITAECKTSRKLNDHTPHQHLIKNGLSSTTGLIKEHY